MSVTIGVVFPPSRADARAFSFFGVNISLDDLFKKTEPQNSQTILFLEAATNIDPISGRGGGDITIVDDSAFLPDVGPSGTIADIESNENQGKISLYVVRSNDTLSKIAEMFGVSVNTIVWGNDLDRKATLSVGQTLVILPVNGIQYTVKKGDTIQGIAKKYKGDVDEIITFNNLVSRGKLAVGDTIIIPGGEEIAPESPKSVPKSSQVRVIAKYPSYAGYYTHPLPGMVAKTQGIHGYNGVDLGAPKGSTVLAAAEGVIIVSRYRDGNPWFGGYGNNIIIEHPNGTQTLYAHLSAVYVHAGVRVEKGQPIAEVGSTGRSTGSHLHFEVRGAKNPF